MLEVLLRLFPHALVFGRSMFHSCSSMQKPYRFYAHGYSDGLHKSQVKPSLRSHADKQGVEIVKYIGMIALSGVSTMGGIWRLSTEWKQSEEGYRSYECSLT
ncbi:hypothetical protein VNO77_03723 [Canavalia gladiata]|uniref:Uncharacterized protein n=1 Tax=Canavalia gladiata TaxID=3824 RepID=A0AAN9R734_CANGL